MSYGASAFRVFVILESVIREFLVHVHGFLIFQVLNETSLWWFVKTQHIISNAVVSSPDKNVTIAKKCSVFPVEFVGGSLNPF